MFRSFYSTIMRHKHKYISGNSVEETFPSKIPTFWPQSVLLCVCYLFFCFGHGSQNKQRLLTIQRLLIGFYNREAECLLRGTDWTWQAFSRALQIFPVSIIPQMFHPPLHLQFCSYQKDKRTRSGNPLKSTARPGSYVAWIDFHFFKGLTFNPLNAKLNPICHLLALLGAHHILHISRIRVKNRASYIYDGRTATLQMLHFMSIFFNKYKYWVF